MNVEQALGIKADRVSAWRWWFRGLGIPEASLGSLAAVRAYLAANLITPETATALDALCQQYEGADFENAGQLISIEGSIRTVREVSAERVQTDFGAASTFRDFQPLYVAWAEATQSLAISLSAAWVADPDTTTVQGLFDLLESGAGATSIASQVVRLQEAYADLYGEAPAPVVLTELVSTTQAGALSVEGVATAFGTAAASTSGAFGTIDVTGGAVAVTTAIAGAYTPA